MSSAVRIPIHTLLRASRARANADARLAAAADARANYIAALRDRAARAGAHAAAVVARERLRRAEEAARRAAALANKLALAEARRNALIMRTRRIRARRAQARRSRVRSVRERRDAACRRSNTRDWRSSTAPKSSSNKNSFDSSSTQLRAAVAFVQSAFLLRRARRALFAAGLKPATLSKIPFPQFSEIVQSRPAQVGASRALRAVGNRATHGGVRTLLSALIIALHPETAGNYRPIIARARFLTSCLYFGSVNAFSHGCNSWPQHFNEWKKHDRELLVNQLAADAVAVDNVIASKTHWKPEMEAHLRRIENAALYIGGQERLVAARASARARKDDVLIHEMLIDLNGFLQQTAKPDEIPSYVWSAVEKDLKESNAPQSRALRDVLAKMADALNGMVANSFEAPQMDDEMLALKVLERTCSALRTSQAPAADDALAEWEKEAYNRLGRDEIYQVLRELADLVLSTAANVRVVRMREVAPIVTQHGHVWERARFDERIAAGEFEATLPRTRTFLNDVDAPQDSDFVRIAVAKLVCGNSSLPEVLTMDFNRIAQLRITAHVAAHVAALVAALRGLGVTNPNVIELRNAMCTDGIEKTVTTAVEQVESSARPLAKRILDRAVHGEPVRILLERIVTTCSSPDTTITTPSALTCVAEDVNAVVLGVHHLADHLAIVHGERLRSLT